MIINRRTFKIKPHLREEAVAVLKEAVESFPAYTGAYRIYTGSLLASVPQNVLVAEFEYDDFEAYQRLWNEWAASPGAAVYFKKSEECFEMGGGNFSNEIWELAASR